MESRVKFRLCYILFIPVPIIEEHPKSGMVELGKDLTLVCKAVGKNLRFTWYKNTKCLLGEVSRFAYILSCMMMMIMLITVIDDYDTDDYDD